MNELVSIQTYEQLKNKLNEELNQAANSFVRIGFLLKLARDNKDILDGSGYTDVNEFAQKEFGLDKTQVSRFIRINDRFSIDGNSMQLLPEYFEYGSAKLSLMLTLPDEINAELSPDMSKTDIQAIKEDFDEEQKISPIEVACEDKDSDAPDGFLECVVKQLNDEHPGPIIYYHDTGNRDCFDEIKDAYIPDGDKIYNIRIAGQGRFMVNMKESNITIINMRDPSIKTPVSWPEFRELVLKDMATRDFTEKKTEPEKKEKPKKVEKSKPKKKVAPVQPKEEVKKVEGEVVKEPSMNPPEDEEDVDEGSLEDKQFEQQILHMLGKITLEIKEAPKTNWGWVKDHLQEIIREINLRA